MVNTAQTRITTAAWNAANPEHRKAANAAWKAANPERVAAANVTWRAVNAEHIITTNAAYRATNPERVAAAAAAWVAKNHVRVLRIRKKAEGKRRAVKQQVPVVPWTHPEYDARMALFDGCYYCSLLGEVGPHEHDDHVFPLVPRRGHRGGTHALRNLVPACAAHNVRKGNKSPQEFIAGLLA